MAGALMSVVTLLLAGCASVAGGGGAGGGAILESLDDASGLPGVEAVRDHGIELNVDIAADATDAEVLDIGAAVNAAATREGRDGRIILSRAGETGTVDAGTADKPTFAPWSVDVLPAEPEEVERRLTGALEVEALGLGTNVSVSSHWPSVTVDPGTDVAAAFASIASTDLFAAGGTYSSGSGEHLMIVHVPERTTVEAVQTIIGITADYPSAEFLLQATEEGPQWPQLLVAGLDAQQGAALDARLRQPDLADADPEGFAQQFQLTVTGPDGQTFIAGTLGDVPR